MPTTSVCRSCLQILRRQAGPATKNRASTSQHTAARPPATPSRPRPLTALSSRTGPPRPAHRRAYATAVTATPPPLRTPKKSLLDSAEDALAVRSSARRLGADAALFAQPNAEAATQTLFKECARQADYVVPQRVNNSANNAGGEVPKNAAGEEVGEGSGWWYDDLKLTPTFNTWAQITFVHMYIITARLRYFPPEVASMWQQHLHDQFFWEAEHRMTVFHDLHSRSVRNRYLKDLYNQWRGCIGAYDEGLMKGDAVLGAAVWRNVWKAAGAKTVNENEEVDWKKIALVVSYMRRCLKALDGAHDQVVAKAMVKFGNPMQEMTIVEEVSPMLEKPFSAEDEKDLEELYK